MAVEDLVKKYIEQKDKLSNIEKAELEQEIWNQTDKVIRKSMLRRDYLSKLLGVMTSETDRRGTLYNIRDKIPELWKLIADGMDVRLAYEIYTIAKCRSTKARSDVGDLVRDVLEDIEKFKIKPHRTSLGLENIKRLKETVRQTQDTPWKDMLGIFTERCGVMKVSDLITREKIIAEFEAELKTLFLTVQTRVKRATKVGITPITQSRFDVVAACRTLGMDPPSVGGLVDITKAKSAKRKLALAYHPDTVGNDKTRELYENVLEAFSLIETYNEGLTR